jgi:predicted Ser/Thr protein kinase
VTAANSLRPGDTIADFRVVRQLGRGGMGVVYLVDDQRLGRQAALKLIAPHLASDPEFQRRFEAEARHAAAIEHTNAVPVYSAGTADGYLFLVMRYVDGVDLRQALAERGSLPVEAAIGILTEVAAALDAAHAAGLVHRDVKPANVLLTGRPGEGTAYLTDFGLTRGFGGSPELTATGQWIGTLDYVAPEQMANGRIDARTDLYALGCVLYEMIAGTVPFPGDEMRKLWSKANEETPPLGASPHPLDPVIARATDRDPERRFRSAGDLARAASAAAGLSAEGTTERSVATGVAATGLPERPPPARRAAIPEPAPRAQPTLRLQQPPPPPPARARHSGRGRAALLIAAAVAVAGGMIAAAAVVSGKQGADSRTVIRRTVPTTTVSTSAAPEEATTAAAETASASEPTSFVGERYSVTLPAGWHQYEREETASDGSYVENVWSSPDGSEEILIDDSPGAPAPPALSASKIGGGVEEAGEQVHAIRDGIFRGGIEGSELDFRADSDPPERADFFFNFGENGFAVLASAYDQATAQSLVAPIVSSLQLRGGE